MVGGVEECGSGWVNRSEGDGSVSVDGRRFGSIFISLEHNAYEKIYSGNTIDTKRSKDPQETH